MKRFLVFLASLSFLAFFWYLVTGVAPWEYATCAWRGGRMQQADLLDQAQCIMPQ